MLTRDELSDVVANNAQAHNSYQEIMAAVDAYTEALLQQTPVSGRSEQLPPVVADEEISAQSIVQCSKELGLGAVTQVYFRKGAKWMRERLGGNCH